MTPSQTALLRQLIAADRAYHSARQSGRLVSMNDRGVEVGAINGVDPRTAAALADAGLIELVDLGRKNTYAFLGRYAPYDQEETES